MTRLGDPWPSKMFPFSQGNQHVAAVEQAMVDEERINPGHENTRALLRTLGPVTFAIGGLLMVVGLGSFFSSFGTFSPPRYFWCCFVAMPFLAAGSAMCKYGFMGAITRYQAGEVAPVGKDAFNYLADGTRPGIQTIAAAVDAGLRGERRENTLHCPSCGHEEDGDAKFCSDCGAAFSKACVSCGKLNGGDAKYCQDCGRSLSAGA
ncbi:MAG: zinc ribbon domain-containing protein [Planctomycetaceae bacterium]